MQNISWIAKSMRLKTSKAHCKDEITHHPMCALTLIAITARIFYFVVIDAPQTENSGWLSVVLGAVMSIPCTIGAYLMMKKWDASLEKGIRSAIGNTGYRFFALFLSLALTFETSSLFTILTSSGAYATLYNMHKLLLLVPTSLTVIYACSKGGNGIGGAAEIWIRIYAVLYIVILFLEYDTMNMMRIFPLLGPGIHVLLGNALNIMLYFCMIPVSILLETGYSVRGRNNVKKVKPQSVLYLFLSCALISAVILVIHCAMYPALTDISQSRSSGMDMMLSNGRSNRTVQLPILMIWFSSLAFSAGYMLYCAGRLMNIALCENGRKCMVLLGIIAMVISLFRLSSRQWSLVFSSFLGPVLCVAFASAPAIGYLRNKGGKGK